MFNRGRHVSHQHVDMPRLLDKPSTGAKQAQVRRVGKHLGPLLAEEDEDRRAHIGIGLGQNDALTFQLSRHPDPTPQLAVSTAR